MAKKGGASRRPFRVLPTVLLTAAILCLPTAVYAWGRTSSSFDITRVRVSGTDLVPRRTVLRLLRSDYLGENLFTVTTGDVEASLHRLCYVEEARVDRDFPDTLRVKVIEHTPRLYVLGRNGWFVVADDAFVICPAGEAAGTASAGASAAEASGSSPSASPSDQPSPGASAATGAGDAQEAGDGDAAAGEVAAGDAAAELTQVDPASPAVRDGPPHAKLRLPALALDALLRPGQTLQQPGLAAALRVTDLLPAGLRRALRVLQVSPRGDVTLQFDGGLDVRWGDRERSLAKMLAMKAVLTAYDKAGREPRFLDVSVPDRVLARPILK